MLSRTDNCWVRAYPVISHDINSIMNTSSWQTSAASYSRTRPPICLRYSRPIINLLDNMSCSSVFLWSSFQLHRSKCRVKFSLDLVVWYRTLYIHICVCPWILCTPLLNVSKISKKNLYSKSRNHGIVARTYWVITF